MKCIENNYLDVGEGCFLNLNQVAYVREAADNETVVFFAAVDSKGGVMRLTLEPEQAKKLLTQLRAPA